ncbi:uncharacterized protein LOC123516859 isoform X2 [Portunus trituberculatus]|uniref:uncharacterized protein LOC123516859 isoform X2 n=1 Tax=Portunus trituberculatus TaxID=210409 RepID=UPI001E1CD9A6|nr:uncharacterized protein LOC123516859 isoform X2 [Portunus trituberculatus]
MSVAPPMNASVLDAVVEAGNLTQWDTLNVPYFISEVLVAVVAVIGNALTITVFVVERKLRRRTNYYIVSLALADLLVGVFGIPFAILTSVGLPRPLWACLFMLSTLLVLCTVSIFCLLAVSVDRYWAILHPLRYSRVMTARIARRIILMCWVAGTLVGLLPVMGWYNTKNEYNQVCYFVKVMSYNYLVFIYFGTIVFPGVLMAAFYTHIYTVVLKQLRQIAAQEPQGDTASVGTQGSQRQRSYIFRSQSRGQVSESSRYDSHRASTNTNLNQLQIPRSPRYGQYKPASPSTLQHSPLLEHTDLQFSPHHRAQHRRHPPNDSLHQYFLHLHGKEGKRSSLEEIDSCSQGENNDKTAQDDGSGSRNGSGDDKAKDEETRGAAHLILDHQPLLGRSRTPSITIDFETPEKDASRLPSSHSEEPGRLLPRERRKSGHECVMSSYRRGSEAHTRRNSEGHSRRSSSAHSRRGSTLSYVLYQMAHPNRREVKAAKSLSIIVLFFMISWFPLYTINCVQAFCKHCTASSGVMFFTITLTHLNSAINPFLYAYHMHDFRAALKSFILHHILRRPLDPDLMINRSVASLHHHSTMHRINVNDACLTNVHTPRSHNSPVSGSPMDGIRSRSSTLGSFGPWDSYKALSTSVSFPSSPAFTTPSSVGAHTNDFLSHRPQVTTLISHGKSILTKDIHDTTDETSQALLPSSVALCVPTTHHSHRLNSHDTLQNNNLNNNLSQTDQQFSLTNSVTSLPPPQTEMDDTADVAVNDDHHRWSLGTDQYEESPARSESEATVQVGDALESKDINNIHNFSEPETMNSTVQPLSDSSLTGSVCTDTNKEQNSKQEGSSSCIAYSTTFPLAPTASIETLHDSPCNGISQPSQDCTEAVSVSDEALSQVACGRLSSQDVEITDASGINQSDAQTPTSLLSNGSACGPMHSSPEEGLSSPTSPVELGPESLIPQVTESEPSIFLRQLGKYLPKILQKKEGGQRPRFFRLQNWWSQDSRHKSYHGISMESRDSTLTRRACSVSGAIGT